jgi:hypothetical protein
MDLSALKTAITEALTPFAAAAAEMNRRAALTDLKRLYVKADVSTGGSVRSPKNDERPELKSRVIDFYGLREPDTGLFFTHMGGPAVSSSDATMAHIWPSAEADAAGLLAGELKLPDAFHINPRNFLILPTDVHRAFDSGWLLFIPKKSEGGLTRVVIRASRVDTVVAQGDPENAATREKREWLRSVDGTFLNFKNDARPFMRVIGWRAWTMRGSADDDAASRDAEVAAADVGSVDAEGNAALCSLAVRGSGLARGAEVS